MFGNLEVRKSFLVGEYVVEVNSIFFGEFLKIVFFLEMKGSIWDFYKYCIIVWKK